MSAITLEITAHRIGGSEMLQRVFVPRVQQMYVGRGDHCVTLDAYHKASDYLRVWFANWTPVREGLFSAEAWIEEVNGARIANSRPVLFNQLPCDVPLYSTHVATSADHGVISLGLRSPVRLWGPSSVAQAEAQQEAGR